MAICKFCDKQIIWGEIGEKKIPLDMRTPVYISDPKAKASPASIVITTTAWVDHRVVCKPEPEPIPSHDFNEPSGAD